MKKLCFMLSLMMFSMVTFSNEEVLAAKGSNKDTGVSLEVYNIKLEDLPEELKKESIKSAKLLGIEPYSEIQISKEDVEKYKLADKATRESISIKNFGSYIQVTGDRNFTVSKSTLVGYNHVTNGNPVRLVQYLLLLVYGNYNVPDMTKTIVDAIFGPNTYSAIKSYQSSRMISSDGIVGPNTWNHLMWDFNFYT